MDVIAGLYLVGLLGYRSSFNSLFFIAVKLALTDSLLSKLVYFLALYAGYFAVFSNCITKVYMEIAACYWYLSVEADLLECCS